MAAIDKTYLKTWYEYTQLHLWCKDAGEVADDWGNKFRPLDYLRDYSYAEWLEYSKNETAEVPVWNTPKYLDIYLIRYCPLDFIQNRLKEQYGEGWSKNAFCETQNTYYDILNRTSAYDTYQRNGVKNPKFKWDLIQPMKGVENLSWWVRMDDSGWDYDEVANYWWPSDEVYYPKSDWISNIAIIKGKLTKRKLARILRKWNLPKGTKLHFEGMFNIKGRQGRWSRDYWNFEITIK